ncbi:MAG: excinuclease ABC subunit UvrC [Magnetococcales bacterium]|nr:excinuclease ABC subunit UvrC [Magnetococcales bacterium]
MADAQHPLQLVAASLPESPGVYRFLDGEGKPLYVGKAKSLRKRVTSYFVRQHPIPRIQVMLGQAVSLEITVTSNENDALILEATLIKQWQPRYNVLLKDNKSYPFLHLSTRHPFPRLAIYRGARKEAGRFFGPYPSVQSLRQTLKLLQRLFPIRQCPDRQFEQRIRPCLQYQIKRCAGPCCGRVTPERYGDWVRQVTLFLEGRDRQLADDLKQAMWAASAVLDFEAAAELRDRLKALDHVQEQRSLGLSRGAGDLDVVAVMERGGLVNVQVFFIRGGSNLGNRDFFPDNAAGATLEEVLEAFLAQFYLQRDPPPEILVDLDLEEAPWLSRVLGERRGGSVLLHQPQRGEKRRLLDMALANADQALTRRLAGQAAHLDRLEKLGEILGLEGPPERIEAFDVSHVQAAHPVGSLVVMGPEGMIRSAYRRHGLEGFPDDTARMAEMVRRRFERLKREEDGQWPDLVLLDGGLGQLHAVLEVADDLQVDGVAFCAMAKGPNRNAGRERLFLPGAESPLILDPRSPVLFLLQNIRDEAHRFAIGYHRLKRGQAQTRSALDQIPGVGPKRKKALLRRFGSVKNLRAAAVADLAGVPGVSEELARRIIDSLQTET